MFWTAVVISIALLLSFLLRSDQDIRVFPKTLPTLLDHPVGPLPNELCDDGSAEIPYGRFRHPLSELKNAKDCMPKPPIQNLSMSDFNQISRHQLQKVLSFVTLKRWVYHSFDTPTHFIGLAVAHLNYVSNAFVYVVDKSTHSKYEYSALTPLGFGVDSFAASSINGCTEFIDPISKVAGFFSSNNSYGLSPRMRLKACFDTEHNSFRISMYGLLKSAEETKTLKLEVSAQLQQSLVLIYPIGYYGREPRPAYVHKATTLPCKGSLDFGHEEISFSPKTCSGVVDWTYAYAARITRWKWVSFSGYAQIPETLQRSQEGSQAESAVSLGINFSDGVYDDENGVSQENGIWINGICYLVKKVIFQLPPVDQQDATPWHMYTEQTDSQQDIKIDLKFLPKGTRKEDVDALIIASQFVQLFGEYYGEISVRGDIIADSISAEEYVTFVVDGMYGVAEDHYAKW